jgi:hypothetical protein
MVSFLPAALNQFWQVSGEITCTVTSCRMEGVVATPEKRKKKGRKSGYGSIHSADKRP